MLLSTSAGVFPEFQAWLPLEQRADKHQAFSGWLQQLLLQAISAKQLASHFSRRWGRPFTFTDVDRGQATTLQPLHLTAFPRAQATTSFQAASLSHPTEFVVSHEAVAIAGEVSSEVIEFSVVARPEAAGQAAARSQLPHPLSGEQHA